MTWVSGRNAVLYAGEVNWDAVGMEGKPRRIESALKSGDSVLVQVTKDPIGHKGARLTSQITLAGRYLVLIPGGSMMGISRKLPDKERARLKKILKAVVPSGSGVIVRTAAEGASEEQIRDDVARLTRQWEDIEKKRTSTKSAPTLLRGEPELAVRVVRDIFNEDFTKLVIEGRDTYATVKEYVDELSPELSDRVEQWVGHGGCLPCASHRRAARQGHGSQGLAAFGRHPHHRPHRGDDRHRRQHRASFIGARRHARGDGHPQQPGGRRGDRRASCACATSAAWSSSTSSTWCCESNRDLVLRRLVECLGRDRTRHQVTEVTSLGLVQMTRKRVGEGLVEAFSTPCEACEGRGFIVHHHPVETSGGDSSSKMGKGSKKQQKKAEARRVEDNVDHERAKEALSAIAAASSRKEDEASGEQEGAPTKKRKARGGSVASAEAAPAEEASVEAAPAEEAPTESAPAAPSASEAAAADDGATKRPRRRRRVAESAPMPELPVHIDLPEPVAHAEQPAAPIKDASEIQLPEQREKAPATRRRASRKAATASSAEPAQAPAAPSRKEAAEQTAPEAPTPAVDEAPAPAVDEAHAPAAPEPPAPRRARKRRAVASTGVVEPDAAPAPIVVDLPARTQTSEPAAPTRSTADIQLPEASDQPRVKRRRRAVSTGIVDAG